LISTIEKKVKFFYFLGKLCSMPYANGVNFRAGTGVEITSGVRFGSLKSLAAFLASRKAHFYNAASAARINLFMYFVSFLLFWRSPRGWLRGCCVRMHGWRSINGDLRRQSMRRCSRKNLSERCPLGNLSAPLVNYSSNPC
jgi:hypothetical protein